MDVRHRRLDAEGIEIRDAGDHVAAPDRPAFLR